jgi:hypothetical protein
LAIALIALAVAIGAWLRPLADSKPPAAPTYTESQVVEAKTNVCAAFDIVHQAIVVTNQRDRGVDPTSVLAVATSARQAAYAGSGYLDTTLAAEPATPPDLAAAIRKLTNVFQKLTIDYLAEVADTELEPLLRAADEATLRIGQLCK